jgi:DNA-binding PadR family transcriptional regulator
MKLLTRSEEFVMLATWKLQDDAYSLPIRKQVSEITGYTWSLSSIYTPLDRLTRKGLLTSSLTAPLPERGGRPRRVYRLTPKGRQALLRIRTVEQAMWAGVMGLSLRGQV